MLDKWSKAAQGSQARIEALETTAGSQKQRLVNLEAIKTKQEMSTPDSGISKRLFGGSSGSHSQNEETSIQELKHDVERLMLWVLRISLVSLKYFLTFSMSFKAAKGEENPRCF